MIVWLMPDSGARSKTDYQILAQHFCKEHPRAELTVQVITRNILWKKIFSLKYPASHEVIPDVVQIPHYWTALLTRAGVAENLSQLAPELSLAACLPQLRAHCYKPGTKDMYSYPWWFDMSALHYRADHLHLVSTDPEKELETWDGLLDICDRLQQQFKQTEGYYPMQNSDWRGSLSTRSAFMEIWGRGSDLLTADLKDTLIDTPTFMQGMHDYISLALKDYMPILRERGSLGTMLTGKASLLMSRKQGVSSFEGQAKVPVHTVPVPRTGAAPQAYLSGMNLMINTASKDKKTALDFIKWCAREDNQLAYAKTMEVFPSLEASFTQLIASASHRLQVYTGILQTARTLPNITITGTVMELLNKVLAVTATQVVEGRFSQADLEKQLQQAAKEVRYLLSLYEG